MTLKLYSQTNCIAELEDYVKELFEKHGLSPDLYPNMLISLTEAVNNAIRHGNLNDEKKEVFIRTRLTETRILCIISDEGEGFDFDNIRTAGRWLYLELYSNSLNANWEIMNVELIGRIEGTR